MANKVVYPAIFINDGDYIFVKFPDVEGAFTQGINIQEAYEMAEEVLGIILSQSESILRQGLLRRLQNYIHTQT